MEGEVPGARFITEYDIEVFGEREAQPNADTDFDEVRKYLKKPSPYTGDNLYDHLTEMLNKLVVERPENVIDFFEDYSRKIKEIRYRDATDHLRDIYISPVQIENANALYKLTEPSIQDGEEADEDEEDEAQKTFVDPMEKFHYFEQVGVGLPKTELYVITLSLRKLAALQPLKTLRFWGKIFGLNSDYYVAEGEYTDEELVRLEGEEEEEEDEGEEAEEEHEEEVEPEGRPKVPRKKPKIPKVIKVKEPVVPPEKVGTGANKRVYYVCNNPGVDQWVKLPDVTPQQIQVSRQIIKYFTGNLEQALETWPVFPGTEKNYLRAQIGRITAGTEVAPLGMFGFTPGGDDEEEEDVEDEEGEGMKTDLFLNKRYQPVSLKDLNDGTYSFWVHTGLYILPQGRCSWWNPKAKKEGEGEEEAEEEEGGEEGDEREVALPLLTPCSEDVPIGKIGPWTVRISSVINPKKAFAVIRSNLWPGAYNFACENKNGHIYIGYGQKYRQYNYSPPPLPCIQNEYPIGPEILEMKDPSGLQEEAWRIAHEKHPPAEEAAAEVAEEEPEDEE